MQGIYRITNTTTGDCYVGQARDITARWFSHRKQLEAGQHHSKRLQTDWQVYGQAIFAFDVLEEVPSRHTLMATEARWITQINPVYNGQMPDAQSTHDPQKRIGSLRQAGEVVTTVTYMRRYTTIRFECVCSQCGEPVDVERAISMGQGEFVRIFAYDQNLGEFLRLICEYGYRYDAPQLSPGVPIPSLPAKARLFHVKDKHAPHPSGATSLHPYIDDEGLLCIPYHCECGRQVVQRLRLDAHLTPVIVDAVEVEPPVEHDDHSS